MVDRIQLRLSATLLFIGILISFVLNFVHPLGAGTEQVAFTEYANSSGWTAIHLGQFVGTIVLNAGLIVLFFALNITEGAPLWAVFFAAVSVGVATALAGVVYAVDGVALKQAVDAWIRAPAAEQATRFATAQSIRWLEWGFRSYEDFVTGIALVLFAIAIVSTARISRAIGYVMGLIGLGFLAVGWLAGTEGLQATTQANVGSITYLAITLWIIWLFVVAWRMREAGQPVPA
jgi:hypothetical protein